MPAPLTRHLMPLMALAALITTATTVQAQTGHYLRIYDETTGGSIVDYLVPLTDADEARVENLHLEPATYRIETTSRVEPAAPSGAGLYRVHRLVNTALMEFDMPINVLSAPTSGAQSYAYVEGAAPETEDDGISLDTGTTLSSTGAWYVNPSTPDREALASTSLNVQTDPAQIDWRVEGYTRVAVPTAASLDVSALSRASLTWRFEVSSPTLLHFNWSARVELDDAPDPTGLSPATPILPENSTPPYVFPAICDRCWLDPPSTYGYEYTVSDVLIVGVTGWSPHLEGPVRVTVGSVDLGLFSPTMPLIFSAHAAELGSLLIDGVGVESFAVSEITPAVIGDDPLAFPIQLTFNAPQTTGLSMTPVGEPTVSVGDAVPSGAWLDIAMAASPNPFNPVSRISYELPQSASVSVTVTDVRGRLVRTLLSGVVQGEGTHHVVWRGDDESGAPVAAGVYLVMVDAGGGRQGRIKTMLVK